VDDLHGARCDGRTRCARTLYRAPMSTRWALIGALAACGSKQAPETPEDALE
jgi:hypothetical protein